MVGFVTEAEECERLRFDVLREGFPETRVDRKVIPPFERQGRGGEVRNDGEKTEGKKKETK